MVAPDYGELVKDAFLKLLDLQRQRETLDVELSKLEQFISATANLLPDEKRNEITERLELVRQVNNLREASLVDAIRSILREAAGHWLTAAHVRDRLLTKGFDFSDYKANPLASVSTTLRRISADDAVETANIDGGVTAYRWRKRLVDRVREAQENKRVQARLSDVVTSGLTPPPQYDDVEDALKAPFKKK